MIVSPGATSQSITVQIVDDSGLVVTGLVASTFPTTSYERVAEALTAISLSDLAALTSAYSSGGVKEVGGGRYRLDIPDAAFATASRELCIIGEATGKHIIHQPIQVAYLPSDVRQLLGTAWLTPAVAGTPDVNTKQLGGTPQTGRDVGASVLLAANQHVITDSGTITTLTNLPSAPNDWLSATAVSAAAVTKMQAGLATPTNITAGTLTSVTTVANPVDLSNSSGTALVAAVAAQITTDHDPGSYARNTEPASVSAIADAVWDELSSGHAIAGSFGVLLVWLGATTDPLLSDVPDGYAEGTAGFALGTLESLSNRIGAGRITVVSSVAQSGQISLIQGDDYTVTLGRALSWTENSSGWPTLTGSTITLEIEDGALIATGSIVVGTGSSKQVRVELTSAQTDLLPLGELRYCLVATFGASRVTLARDKCIVSDREDGE